MTRRLAIIALAVTACGGAEDRPPAVVDSVVAWDTALARFREATPPATTFQNGLPSLEALVDTFLVRLQRADTAGLRALTMTRGEFGWLYYASQPEARPPYDLSPELMWFTIQGHGGRGLQSLLTERAGRPLDVVGWTCPEPQVLDANQVRTPCLIRRRAAGGQIMAERLFGPVVERDGVFKLLNLSTGL